jgi:hypothetical protein
VEIEARFIPSVRKYAVTLDGVTEDIDYGSLLTKPADPTKESDEGYDYTFDNWYIKGTDTVWNFETDKVSGEVEIEARFNATARIYAINFGVVSDSINFGSEIFSAYEFTEEDMASM